MTDEWGLVANVVSDKAFRAGAKVYLLQRYGCAERALVCGVSRGGRRIFKHIPFKRLEFFRAAWVPPRLRDRCGFVFASKDEAAASARLLAGVWEGVRFFSEDGKELQAGVSPSEAFARWEGLIKGV